MLRTILLALVALGCASRLTAADKPVPVAEAASRMTVPEGFRVTLFAGEPDVVQPIAFTFDTRGRMWVVECLSYPIWSKDGTGRDRVVILEDTDGDGRFDKKTVFLDNGSNLSGIEFGFGGVWLCSSPNLLFVPLKDDKPAGPPVVVLDGWNIKDTKHNVFNSLGWGPDGWLYGCNGIQAKAWVGKPGTPQKDRTYMDCGVWRYHPTRKLFEVVAHGTTNPWGLDWDDHGEMFITNCVIDHLWHVVPGGHYQRMYGQDANPYVFGLMGPCSDHKHWAGGHWTEARADQKTGAVKKQHDDAGGGHAHSGCAIYLGDNFPAEYRNSVFMCNIHGNRLNRDTLHRENGRYAGKHAPDFLHANDPWFRGICVKQGPEGGLYVSDWCDTGECHNYDKADTSNGRIYRVTYGSPKPFRGDVAAMTDEELVKLQLSKNEWLVRQARRVLQERAAVGTLRKETREELRSMAKALADVKWDLRRVWMLHVIGELTAAEYTGLLRANGEIRGWAARLGLESTKFDPQFFEALCEASRAERDPQVRYQYAAAVQRLGNEDRLKFFFKTYPTWCDSSDSDLTLMYWYAFQPVVLAETDLVLKRLELFRNSTIRVNAIRCLLTAQQGAGFSEVLDRLTREITLSNVQYQRDILRGMREALAGRSDVKMPTSWQHLLPQLRLLKADPSVFDLAVDVGLIFHDPSAISTLRSRVADEGLSAEIRRSAIERLAAYRIPDVTSDFRTVLSDAAVRGSAIRALAAYSDSKTPPAILKAYPSLTAAEKADAVQTLASRPAFALALLDAVEKGAVPKADVTAFTARQIQALNNKPVSDRLAAVWGTVRPASATRAAQAEKYRKLLTADALKAADRSNGRAVFTRSCAACHKLFGEGGDVGPELTGSQRANLDYVLENVLDPSAVVPGEYRMTAFTLADGRVLTGIVRKETPRAVTVRTLNEELTIPVADIESRKQTPLSIMPDGLFDALTDDEVRDLVAYLASPQQVPKK